MSLLLVNTNKETRPVPALPIGLLRVLDACVAAGIDTTLLDLAFEPDPAAALREAVHDHDPLVVGFGVRNVDNADAQSPKYYLPAVAELVESLRRGRPDIVAVAGGAGVSVWPEQIREVLGVDCVVAGPGELAMPRIHRRVASLAGELPPVVHGEAGAFAPMPDFSTLDLARYRKLSAPLPVQSRRGCPYRCVYCNYAAVEGTTRYDLGAIERVVEAIRRETEATGIREIEFVDSTFNSPPNYTRALCDALAEADLGVSIHGSGIAPRASDRATLEAMARAGFRWIHCSPDSASDTVLERYGKGCTQADLADMVQATRDVGLAVMWSFLFGGPGETMETAAETVRFVEASIHPDDVVLFGTRMRIYPNTRLANIAAQEGYPPTSLDPRAGGQFYVSPDVDPWELDRLLRDAHHRLANVMFLDEGQKPMVGFVQRIHGLFGGGRPAWAAYPVMRRTLMRLGLH